jgi:oligopeptide/dipeptide ABC transporter ATP-binding protein
MALVAVRNLVKVFDDRRRRPVQALRGVDLEIGEGEILGLVGESGCGKSTLGRCILRLEEPSSGQVLFDGVDVTALSRRALRRFRRQMQMVFQDPFQSLNPRMTVEETVGEPLVIHGLCGPKERAERVAGLLEEVGLSAEVMQRYPHEFSGGQRQRVGIARALAAKPRFIVADEPVSALDVSVQAQILNLLRDLQRAGELTYLFISHDLRVVRRICHRTAVMYLGQIVEEGPTEAVATEAVHPYTRALVAAIPVVRREGDRQLLGGEVPDPRDPPTGCPFHPRCPLFSERANPACTRRVPALERVGERRVACHEVEDRAGTG